MLTDQSTVPGKTSLQARMAKYKGGVMLQEIAHLRRRDLEHPVLPPSLLFPYYLLYAVYLLYMVRFLLVAWLMMLKAPSAVATYFTYDRLYGFVNVMTGNDEYFLIVIFFASISTGIIHYNVYCKRHTLLWEMFCPLLQLTLPTASASESLGRLQRLTQKMPSVFGRRHSGVKSEKNRRHHSVVSSITGDDTQGTPLHFANLDETHLRRVSQMSRFYQTVYLCFPYGCKLTVQNALKPFISFFFNRHSPFWEFLHLLHSLLRR